MVRSDRPPARRERSLAPLAAAVALSAATFAFAGSSGAGASVAVADLSGGAFGHYTKVSLFGGPAIPNGPVPDVRLPSPGAERGLTAKEAAGSAVYGPAHIFGGKWPPDVSPAPPSGPITVSTKATSGASRSVTSTVDIGLRTPPDAKSPGGWGPLPPSEGDELHSTCTATEAGATGSVRFVKAVMSKSTDPDGNPTEVEPVPDNPPVNYTREGILANVGDKYKIVYNEQFVEPDGSITVNAVHLYLLGDIAVGEQIVGQVRCSTTGAAFATTPARPANSPAPSASNDSTALPTEAKKASSDSNALPFALGGVALVAVLTTVVVVTRRRGRAKGEPVA